MASTTRKGVSRRALQQGEFAKYHGLGIDYLVMHGEKLTPRLTEHRIRAICERNTGVGADGILVFERGRNSDFDVRIFNPDGSEAEKSGNGVRILARCLWDLGYTRKKSFTIGTPGGEVGADLLMRDGRVARIRLHMGRPSFRSSEIPITGPDRDVVNEAFTVGSREIRITCVSLGNPHCVIFVPRLVLEDLERLGSVIATHPGFPNGTNVQLARVCSRHRVEALIWERGAGETLASGTSSCAIAAAAFRNGLVENSVEIAMRGGSLQIEIRDDATMRLTGSATPVFRGRLL